MTSYYFGPEIALVRLSFFKDSPLSGFPELNQLWFLFMLKLSKFGLMHWFLWVREWMAEVGKFCRTVCISEASCIIPFASASLKQDVAPQLFKLTIFSSSS